MRIDIISPVENLENYFFYFTVTAFLQLLESIVLLIYLTMSQEQGYSSREQF